MSLVQHQAQWETNKIIFKNQMPTFLSTSYLPLTYYITICFRVSPFGILLEVGSQTSGSRDRLLAQHGADHWTPLFSSSIKLSCLFIYLSGQEGGMQPTFWVYPVPPKILMNRYNFSNYCVLQDSPPVLTRTTGWFQISTSVIRCKSEQ